MQTVTQTQFEQIKRAPLHLFTGLVAHRVVFADVAILLSIVPNATTSRDGTFAFTVSK